MWDEGIWPAFLFKDDSGAPETDRVATILQFIRIFHQFGVKWLYGVPGHSIYVVLTGKDPVDAASPTPPLGSSECWPETKTCRDLFREVIGLSGGDLDLEQRTFVDQLIASISMTSPLGRKLYGERSEILRREHELTQRESRAAQQEQELARREQELNSH
jgi:hypothetical protein